MQQVFTHKPRGYKNLGVHFCEALIEPAPRLDGAAQGVLDGMGVRAGVGLLTPGAGVAVFPGRRVGVSVGLAVGRGPMGVRVGVAMLRRWSRASVRISEVIVPEGKESSRFQSLMASPQLLRPSCESARQYTASAFS